MSLDRGSNHHSPRVDDAMKHETEGLVRAGHDNRGEEWRSAEPSGEDQPDVDRAPDTTLTGGVPSGMTPEDVERRSELAVYLGRGSFPAVQTMLVDSAREHEAPDRVIAELQRLPAGREYANIGEVWAALGGGHEDHRT